MSSIPADFDPDVYLALNPDVAEAVMTGVVSSAQDHFAAFGVAEARRYKQPKPVILHPRDWSRISESSFHVVAADLPGDDVLLRCWRSSAFMQQELGPRAPLVTERRLIRDGVFWTARLDLDDPDTYVLGIVDLFRPDEPLALAGVFLGVSDNTALLRRPRSPDRTTVQYPLHAVRRDSSNFAAQDARFVSKPAPTSVRTADFSASADAGPAVEVVSAPESHNASDALILQHCVGTELETFQRELARSSWSSGFSYLAAFTEADLYMRQGVIVDAEGMWSDTAYAALPLDPNLDGFRDLFLYENRAGRIPDLQQTPRIEGTSYMIGNAGWGNFAHWIMNSLFAAYVIEDRMRRDGGRILCPPLPSYARESLHLLGLESLVVERAEAKLRAERLIYPSYLSTHFNMFPSRQVRSFVEHIKNRAQASLEYGKIEQPEFIYLTRKGYASTRNLSNEDDLLRRLVDLRFRPVATHELNFVEKIAAFSRAKIIVGQMGASMAHILFAPPGCVIVEITTSNFHSNEYLYAASLLDLRYVRVMVDVPPQQIRTAGSFDFAAPIEAIIASVEAVQQDLTPDHGEMTRQFLGRE